MAFALDLFGDRWTLLVIRDLAMRGMSTYGEFLNSGEAISTNILADRLKRLEAAEIVTKERDPEHGAKFRYSLTDKGLDLIPVMIEMIRWSAKYDPDTPVAKGLKRRIERDARAVAADLRKRGRIDNK